MTLDIKGTDINTGASFEPGHPGFSKETLEAVCIDCKDEACWKGCHNIWNPFGQIGKDLEKLRKSMPPDCYWQDASVRKEVKNWTYRMYTSYHRRSLWCRCLLDKIADEMWYGMYKAASKKPVSITKFIESPRSLPELLGLSEFDAAQDLLEQVSLGLAALERRLEDLYKKETKVRRVIADENFRQLCPEYFKSAPQEEEARPSPPQKSQQPARISRPSSSDTIVASPQLSGKAQLAVKDSQSKVIEVQHKPDSRTNLLEAYPRNPPAVVKNALTNSISQDASQQETKKKQANKDSDVQLEIAPPKVVPSAGATGTLDPGRASLPEPKKVSKKGKSSKARNKETASMLSSPLIGTASNKNSSASALTGNPPSQSSSLVQSPPWTRQHEPGSLTYLGLVPNNFNVTTHTLPGKKPCPDSTHLSKANQKPTTGWLIYSILSRVPGGWLSTDVLVGIALEWCSWYKEEGKEVTGRTTIKSQACRGEAFIREERDGISGRRIADIGEKQDKAPGPGHPGYHAAPEKNQKQKKRKRESSRLGQLPNLTSRTFPLY